MQDIAIARALHVLAVVMWIGGVAFVTTVMLPTIRHSNAPEQRFPSFHTMESRFAWQARLLVLLAGATGFYMVWRLDAWSRFDSLRFWWMHAMVCVWLIFTLMLFVIEPVFLHRRLARRAAIAPERTFARVEWMHRILLVLSLLTVVGAVAGAYGFG